MSEHGGMDADAFRHLSPQYTCRSCCSAETFRLAQKFRERLLAGSAGTASCRLVGTCLPFYAYFGRLSLTLLTETRDDKKCPADSESSDTCRPQTVSASTLQTRSSSGLLTPIYSTFQAAYWDIGCRITGKSALTLIPV